MKNQSLLFLLVTCIGLGSCKNNKSETLIKAEEPVSEQCYKALYEQDTLDLKINTFKDGRITGFMKMSVIGMPKMDGEISGKFHGDTLYTSYSYTEDEDKEISYKNPMAFLKRGNKIILGNWETMSILGASYNVKGKHIDFDSVKFIFTPVDCVNK